MCQAKSYGTINLIGFLQHAHFPLIAKTYCNFLWIKCWFWLCANVQLKKGSGLPALCTEVLIYPQKQTVQEQWLKQTS